MARTSRYTLSRARRGNSTLVHANRGSSIHGGSSSRCRIRWPWFLEPSSHTSTTTPPPVGCRRTPSSTSRSRNTGRFMINVNPIPFINLESDDDVGVNEEQSEMFAAECWSRADFNSVDQGRAAQYDRDMQTALKQSLEP